MDVSGWLGVGFRRSGLSSSSAPRLQSQRKSKLKLARRVRKICLFSRNQERASLSLSRPDHPLVKSDITHTIAYPSPPIYFTFSLWPLTAPSPSGNLYSMCGVFVSVVGSCQVLHPNSRKAARVQRMVHRADKMVVRKKEAQTKMLRRGT